MASADGGGGKEISAEQVARIFEDARERKLTFLLLGRTGVGKSSTINSLLGVPLAPVGDHEPTTMEVKAYPGVIEGVHVTVVDTPGLCDDLEEVGNDDRYLHEIQKNAPALDSVWFVSRLDETRVTGDEKRAIKLISQGFGEGFWSHAIVVFTHAMSVSQDRFEHTLNERLRLVRQEIARYVDPKIADQIPGVAVDNTSPNTPDGEPWLGELFTTVTERMGDGAVPFLLAMSKSLGPSAKSKKARKSSGSASGRGADRPRITLDDSQQERVKNTIDGGVIGGAVLAGAAIGTLFGPGGTVVGGAIGAAIGVWAWLSGR